MSAPASRAEPTAPPAEPAVSFEALLEPLLSPAYGAALHMTRDRADAEDVVQEAALLAFRAFHTFQPGTNFKAWFFRILTNCFRSMCRKRHGERGLCQLEEASELYLYQRTYEA